MKTKHGHRVAFLTPNTFFDIDPELHPTLGRWYVVTTTIETFEVGGLRSLKSEEFVEHPTEGAARAAIAKRLDK